MIATCLMVAPFPNTSLAGGGQDPVCRTVCSSRHVERMHVLDSMHVLQSMHVL